MTTELLSSARRILVIDDSAEIHDDFRKIPIPPERPRSLALAKAALFGEEQPAPPAKERPRYSLDCALQGREGVAMARAAREAGEPYQVAFIDMRMPPGWNGAETIEELWKVDHEIQVVICTAFSDLSLDSLADHFGQSERLLLLKKPFESGEILQLAATLSEKWLNERHIRQKVSELEHHLLHDRLTGLPNRALLTDRLQACMLRYQRNPAHAHALLFLDCDGFKLINDSLGHEVGDRMLIELAERMTDSLRATDLVSKTSLPSRLGGDEFLVLLEDLNDASDSVLVAERLLEALSQPYEIDTEKLSLTVSIGITACGPTYTDASQMIRDADTAMYRAKSAGGGQYAIFDAEMHVAARQRLALINRLRTAVHDDQIDLYYQPIIRLADCRLAGWEALARWRDVDLGFVPPSQFIAVAEQIGLIRTLGANLLRRACAQLAAWRVRYPEATSGLHMSVNVSRKQLAGSDLAELVEQTLRETGLAAQDLVLEITEGLVLDDFETAVGALERLRQLGIKLHMDDFGTGYSSLSHVYKLPLAALKIDREFVVDAHSRPSHRRALEAIVSIARSFDLAVVGEGIERSEQLALLRQLGVELGQGYLFGKPVTADEAERWLASGTPLWDAHPGHSGSR